MFCCASAPPFEDSNLVKVWREVQSEKSARIGCQERKRTVSVATVEMRPLASTGPQYKGPQQLTTSPTLIKSDRLDNRSGWYREGPHPDLTVGAEMQACDLGPS